MMLLNAKVVLDRYLIVKNVHGQQNKNVFIVPNVKKTINYQMIIFHVQKNHQAKL